jgi:hypothetical protein
MKTLDTFDFAATDGAISATQLAELARGEWIGRAGNIIFAGPIGTGKTHLAIDDAVDGAMLDAEGDRGGRFEAMCGKCLRRSVSLPAETEEQTWSELQKIGGTEP